MNRRYRIVERPPSGEELRDKPDAHLVMEDEPGTSCSVWWRATPAQDGRRVGAIGHFKAADAEGGGAMLLAACARLAAHGCPVAFGPMDGNTWRRYRAVTDYGDEPAFFLEPHTPPQARDSFVRAGFSVAARYASSVQDGVRQRDPRIERVARRAAAAGITIRAIDRHAAQRDLVAIHALSLAAFSNAFLFSPISRDEFLAQYLQLLPDAEPRLVLVAEQAGEVVAFGLGLPDLLDARRTTVVLKTVAQRPGLPYMGLGHLLVERGGEIAAGLGYRRVVHALMHEENRSFGWSGRYGRVIRRYALFSRSL